MQQIIALIMLVASADIASEKPLPIPMTQNVWQEMSEARKLQYADITIQGLRRNPQLALCENLTSDNLVKQINDQGQQNEPLMMTIARVAYSIC